MLHASLSPLVSHAVRGVVRGSRPFSAPTLAHKLRELLPADLVVIDKARRVKDSSQDANWFSPPLRAELRDKTAECLLRPQSEAHVVAAARACAQLRVPLTPRGAGTGNYGQAVPLAGGVVVDLSGLDGFEVLEPGLCRVGAGLNMARLEQQLREHGEEGGAKGTSGSPWELRMHPSTLSSATIGGFVAGGSGGVGSINYGVLRDPANVAGLRVVTMEEEPRVLELSGAECDPAIHAYGTNGIITSLDMPLAPSWPWQEMVVAFEGSFEDAASFGLALGEAVGVVKKQVAVFGAPIAHRFFKRLVKTPRDATKPTASEFAADPGVLGAGTHVALVVVARPSVDAVQALAAEHGGWVGGTRCAAAAREAGAVPLYEFCWNHTTLHAIRKDPQITYLQTAFEAERCVELAVRAHHEVGARAGTSDGPELMSHLEFVNMGGRVGAFGIPLLQYSSEARMQELIGQYEAMGCPVFNPHTYVLEDGGMKETDWAQLEFKRRVDPLGLLNVGKMRAFDEQREVVAADGIGYDRVRRGSSSGGGVGSGGEGGEGGACGSTEPAAPTVVPANAGRWLWEELTTVEHAALDKARAVAVLPIGAVEQHGPHLPVGVDAMHNEGVLERAMQLLPAALLGRPDGVGDGSNDTDAGAPSPVLVLPAQRVGSSHEHLAFSGTLSHSSKTYIELLVELGEAVARSGVRKLVLFNSHGGQCAHADIVARRLRIEQQMLVVVSNGFRAWPVQDAFSERECSFGIHGGGIETAVMQHLRPDLVHGEELEDFASRAEALQQGRGADAGAGGFKHVFPHSPAVSFGWMAQDLNASGTVGDAHDADPVRGEAIVDSAARDLSELLAELVSADVDSILNLKHKPSSLWK
eukprot:g83.t1